MEDDVMPHLSNYYIDESTMRLSKIGKNKDFN